MKERTFLIIDGTARDERGFTGHWIEGGGGIGSLMESAAAILRPPEPAWEDKAGTPSLTVLERPVIEEIAPPEPVVIPTRKVMRMQYLLAKVGPPLVFALAVAGIVWFWPPF
jgi:hypothetical protein